MKKEFFAESPVPRNLRLFKIGSNALLEANRILTSL